MANFPASTYGKPTYVGTKPPKKKAPKKKKPTGGTKKASKSTKSSKLLKEPFDPLAPGYQTPGAFEKALRLRARRQYEPEMNELQRLGRLEGSRHSGRLRDIGQFYGYQDEQLKNALGATTSQLNQLIASSSGANQSAQAGLLAALNASRAADRESSQTIGGGPVGNETAFQALQSSLGAGSSGTNALAQTFGGIAAERAGQLNVSTAQRGKSLADESSRTRAIMEELGQERLALIRSIPGIEAETRQRMIEEEIRKAAQRVQNKLASKELGETIRSNKAQEGLAGQELAMSAKGAKGEASGKKAETSAAAWEAGQTTMAEYIQTTLDQGGRPNPMELFRMLRQQLRLNENQVINIMRSSGNGIIKKWANQRRKLGRKGQKRKQAKKAAVEAFPKF